MPVNVFSVSLHFFYIIFLFHLLSKKKQYARTKLTSSTETRSTTLMLLLLYIIPIWHAPRCSVGVLDSVGRIYIHNNNKNNKKNRKTANILLAFSMLDFSRCAFGFFSISVQNCVQKSRFDVFSHTHFTIFDIFQMKNFLLLLVLLW